MLNISGSYSPAQQSKIGFIAVYVFTYIIYVSPVLDYILVKLSIILCLSHEIQAQGSTDVHGHIVLHTQLEYMKNREILRAHSTQNLESVTSIHISLLMCTVYVIGTVKPVLNGISRDRNILPLKAGFRSIKVHCTQKLNQNLHVFEAK